MIVLPLLGGALAILSWRAAFVPFLLVVLLALAAMLWMPETGRPGQDSLGNIWRAPRARSASRG